jgi:ABC-type enterochelin transport system permease subunit
VAIARLPAVIMDVELQDRDKNGEKIMNLRLIVFSGAVTALIGIVFGLSVSKMSQRPFQCCDLVHRPEFIQGFSTSRSPRTYAIIGAASGFAIGALIETVRQNKPAELD